MKAPAQRARRGLVNAMRAPRWRRFVPVVVCPLVAAIVAFVYGQTIAHTYEAKAEIAIALSAKQLERQRDKRGVPVLSAETLARSWADIPGLDSFRDQVAAKPGVGYTASALEQRIRARHVDGTNRIWLSVRSSNASRAARVADAATANMLIWIRQWPRRPATARLLTPAAEPKWPVDPDIPNAVLVAAVIGLSIGAISAMLLPSSSDGARRAAVAG